MNVEAFAGTLAARKTIQHAKDLLNVEHNMTLLPAQNTRCLQNTKSEAAKRQSHFYFLDRVSNVD